MQKVVVKFYQDIRDATGIPSVEVNIEESTPLTIFLNLLGERFEKLKPLLTNIQTDKASVIILINGRAPIPLSSAVLTGGEKISILPMVEGG